MRKGLSSQPVDSHPNRRHELELLFVPPGHQESDDDFELKYPYPDESPYLETYDYPGPGPYLGAYPESYPDGGENFPYPGEVDYPGEERYPSPGRYHDQDNRYPDPYGGRYHDQYGGRYPDPYGNRYATYPSPVYPEHSQLHNNHINHNNQGQAPETLTSVHLSDRKGVRFPHGTRDIHPPPVERVLTPHHVSVWKRDKHPIRTAESSVGILTPEFNGYTFEEEQKLLYEGLCEKLLKQRARDMRLSQQTFTDQPNWETRHGVQFGGEENLGDTLPFPQIPTKGVCVQPMSKFSSVTDDTVSRDSIDTVLSNQFASVQDSIRVAVNRGIEGRHGMVYSRNNSPSVVVGSSSLYDGSSSRACMLSQIRHRVSSTATLFKQVVSRPFRHKGPKGDEECQLEWRVVSSRGKRGVSRLFRRPSSSKWVALNDHERDGGARQGGEYGWNQRLNGGAPTFL